MQRESLGYNIQHHNCSTLDFLWLLLTLTSMFENSTQHYLVRLTIKPVILSPLSACCPLESTESRAELLVLVKYIHTLDCGPGQTLLDIWINNLIQKFLIQKMTASSQSSSSPRAGGRVGGWDWRSWKVSVLGPLVGVQNICRVPVHIIRCNSTFLMGSLYIT